MEKKIALGLLLTLFILFFISVYWIKEPARQEAARQRLKLEAMERGAELFSAYCALCHGGKGEGRIGPPLRPDLARKFEDDDLFKTISRGRPGTAMPAWGEGEGGPLRPYQIRDLVVFIQNWDSALLAERPAPLSPTPTPTPTATYTLTSTGEEARAGEKLFSSPQLGCSACHQASGVGGALGPSFDGLYGSTRKLTTGEKVIVDEAYLRESILNPNTKVAEGFPTGIMPQDFGTRLSEEDLKNLVAFIKSLAK